MRDDSTVKYPRWCSGDVSLPPARKQRQDANDRQTILRWLTPTEYAAQQSDFLHCPTPKGNRVVAVELDGSGDRSEGENAGRGGCQ
jgi:hypothetical protein